MQQQVLRQSVRRPARVPMRPRGSGLALREGRREANRDEVWRESDLRCECAREGCQARLPFSAERHRGRSVGERFLVAPSHFGTDTVVAAADSFFVVEPGWESRGRR